MDTVAKAGKNGIKISDREAVAAYLKSVFGKATAWTASVSDVIEHAEIAEKRLTEKGVAKSRRVGAEFIFETSSPTSKKYRHPVICSIVRYRRYPNGWRVMSAERNECWPGYEGSTALLLPIEEVERIERRAVKAALEGIYSLPRNTDEEDIPF